MALESVTYISDLVSTNPTSSDGLSQGDDHIKNIKSALLTTFPNVTGAVTPTHTQLNYVTGVTSAIQTQLDGLLDIDRITSYASPRGKCVAVSAGFTINTTDSLAAGDTFWVYNASDAGITIAQGSGMTVRLAGTTTTGDRTLAARGFAMVWMNSGTEAIVSGTGVS